MTRSDFVIEKLYPGNHKKKKSFTILVLVMNITYL